MDLVEAKARGFVSGIRHPWETARIEVVDALIRRHVTLGPEATVLDIGCGDTFVTEQLASRYPDLWFFAVDTAFTDEIMSRYRARFQDRQVLPLRSLDLVPPLGRPASLVLLMDVLEHIDDETAFLTQLKQRPFMGPDTRLLITVPAYQTLFCGDDVFLGHCRRYSNQALRARLDAAGLQVLDIGYFFSSLLLIRLVQVLKERLTGRPPAESTGLVEWEGGPSEAGILTRMLALDAAVSMRLRRIGIRLPGLSNYAVCIPGV